MSRAIDNYNLWVKKVKDADIAAQLVDMRGDAAAIENAFYKDLDFGTGGLRGIIGAGTACLNIYTVGKTTEGVARFMKDKDLTSAAISYDSRINSELFARTAARVLASNGITVYITPELMPTPVASYCVRALKCGMGIMITASHNPAEYNGYKLYGADGCQVMDTDAAAVKGYIDGVDIFEVNTDNYDKGLIKVIDQKVIDEYIAEVMSVSLGRVDGLKVVFSPFNGAGYKLVPQVLQKLGAEVIVVPEQAMPDGNFVTCPYPNPEKSAALELGLKLAQKEQADILIATDPDADRVGVAVRHGGEYKPLTGNETGVLLVDYMLDGKKAAGTLPTNPLIVKTIVTSGLGAKVAEGYGAETVDVLTGFKYIGGIMEKLAAKGELDRFVMGYEESYGYLAGTHVRDKDAVVAAMLIAEMTDKYKNAGKSLVDVLEQIFQKYGYYQHNGFSYEYAGASGSTKMKKLLADLRGNLPTVIGGLKVTRTIDYLTQREFDLPKADVLQFDLEGGAQAIVRPSGTEPLIKIYLTACKTREENAKLFAVMQADMDKLLK